MARVKDTGYVNPQEVYNYLVNVKGLSREHALGMLSNIQAESGFKIAVQEYGKPQGTGGVGLFQHTGPRRQALVKYTGGDVNDWTKQVDFALQEGVTKTYLSQKFETPEEASIWFTTKWERPANANQRAQERLKYLNNYSNFSGYESTYQPSSSSSSQGAGQNAQQGAAQMPIPFEVVIAGKPQQVAFSYEDFQKALATTQKEEEKEQESEARQELKQEMTTQEAFLKAMESISLPSASSQGNQQQQFASQGTTGYEPLPIPEVSTALPQLPNIFSTQLPQMRGGGEPIKTIDGIQYVQDAQGNWKYASGAPVTDLALAQRLQYEPERPATQGAPKSTPATIKAQQTAKQINSPVIAEQKQATADKIASDQLRESIRVEAQDRWKTLPQSAGSADWVFAAPMVAPMALEALGAAASTQILGTGVSVGTALNTGFGIHGATQVGQRMDEWQDVYEGNMDWREATAKSLMTGLEVAGGIAELGNLAQTTATTAKGIYEASKGSNLAFATAPEAQAARALQEAGLLSKSIDPKVLGRFPGLGQSTTRQALKNYNTTYRAVTPDLTNASVEELMNMAKSGVTNFDDPVQVAQYMSTHVPMESYGYRANILHPGIGQEILYTGKYSNAQEAAKKLKTYGTYLTEVRPPMDFSKGTPVDWFNNYYKNKPFGLDEFGQKVTELKNPGEWYKGYKPGTIAGRRDLEYWPYIGQKGEKLLEPVRTVNIGAEESSASALGSIDLTRTTRAAETTSTAKKPVWDLDKDINDNLQILKPRHTQETAFKEGRELFKVQSKSNSKHYVSLKGKTVNGEQQVYFSASMPNQLEAGRALKELESRIPKGTVIIEPNSLSMDSYLAMLKRGLNNKKFTSFPGDYVPLNKSAVHNLLPNQTKILETESPFITFKTLEDAQEAVKHINSQVPSKFKALKAVAKQSEEGDGYGIMIRTIKLRKEFRKGGQTSPQDTKEMLDGIAEILRQVVNVNNRKAIAKNMIGDFNREGLDYDLNNFLRSSQVKMLEGGPVKPPTFNLSYNPYVYNPNELTGYRGYGDLSGTSLGVSTPDLLGREKKINALKVPFSASANRLYDPNVQNTTIDYSDQQNLNQGMTAEQLQTGAQQQLDSASQPYLDKNPLGFNIQTGVSGSGLNSNVKRRTKIDASVGVGYNPLSGFNAGASGKFSFALGNDFYRPLKNTGDWRAVGNVQPFGMSVNQLSAYNEQQDMIQSNLQQVASTGAYSDLTQNVNNYDNTKPGVASGVQFTLGAGVDGSVKLPIGMLNAGAGLKYNRAAGEAERLSPTAYVGYSVSGAELSRLGSKLPNINLPDNRRSNYETLANQDLEAEKGEWVQGPDGQFTWRDFPGFNGAFNASTFEGEDIYVPTVLPNKQNGGVVKTFALF